MPHLVLLGDSIFGNPAFVVGLPRRFRRPCIAFALLASTLLPAEMRAQGSTVPRDSAAFAGAAVIRLRNGPNPVDIAGDGSQGTVFVARRENFNAHGYSTIAFYVHANGDGLPAEWHTIPFVGGRYDEHLATHEGADCILTDVRIVRARRGEPVTVIVGRRDEGDSFAAPAAVRFDVYRLVRNSESLAGEPLYRFERERTIPSGREWCDVNEAFRRELGLGAAGVAEAEGGR